MIAGAGLPGRVLVFCLVLSLVCGCMKVGPDFSRPAVAINPQWLEAQGFPQVSTGPEDYRSWWQTFHDPLLEQLVQSAYQQNLPLQQAGVRVLAAQAQLGAVIGKLYPQTQQAAGSLTRVRASETSPVSGPGTPIYFWTSQYGLNAGWELDFWGKYRRAVEAADADLQAAVADYDNALVSLTGEVAAAYVALRTLEKRLQIARQNVTVQRQSLRIATSRWRGGTTSKRDVEQAQTILDSTEADIPSLESLVRQTQNALSLLLGLPPQNLEQLQGRTALIPVPPPLVAVGIPADLLRRRPDIRRAEWQAAAACARIGTIKADLYPSFALTGSFGFQASDVGNYVLGNMFNWLSRTGRGGPAFQWNILNYGQITNQVRVQDARFQEALLEYQNSVLRAQREVEDALIAFLKGQQRAQKLAEAVGAAQASLELAMKQYQQGITDFTTVLTAQQALLAQQDNLAITLGDISTNLVKVYRALGGGWQIREGQDFVPGHIKSAMAQRTNWGRLLAAPMVPAASLAAGRPDVRPPVW